MAGNRRRGYFLALALVGLLASTNFLVGLAEPRGTIWDESYYLTSTQRYGEHIAQFASHPPLGLMLIAAGNAVLHPNGALDTHSFAATKSVAGRQIPAGFSFAGVRLASGLFAVLAAMVFFALMFALTGSTVEALVFSNLFTFENAFIAQFRAAQLDAFQIAFTTVALLCFVKSLQRQQRSSPILEFGFGAACGLAMMVKLNAAVLLVLGAMLVVRRVFLGRRDTAHGRLLLIATRDAAAQCAGCLLVIGAVFTLHIVVSGHYMDPASPAGQKDGRFLSAQYGEYLQGRRPLSVSVVANAADDYRRFMAADFDGVPRTDPNGSSVLQWPLESRTINYRWDSDGKRTAYVQLVGNKVSWILALMAPFAGLGLLVLQWWRPAACPCAGAAFGAGAAHRAGPDAGAGAHAAGRIGVGTRAGDADAGAATRRATIAMLLIAYGAFMVLHGLLGTHRVMYLYHYFIGLLLTFTLLPLVFNEALHRWPRAQRWRSTALAVFTVLLLGSFVFYSPLTFHRPLTHDQCALRNLFQQVVDCRP